MKNNNINIENFYDLPGHVYLKDKHGIYLECNDFQAKNAGYNMGSDIVGLTDYDLIWGEGAPVLRINDLEVIKSQKQIITMEVMTLDSGVTLSAFSYKLPYYSSGKVIGTLGFSFPQGQQLSLCPLPLNKKQYLEYGLSKREMQCLCYLTKGKTAKETARYLKISPRTVESIIDNTKIKLRCNTRSELINIAFKIPAIKNKLLYDIAD